LPSPVDPENSLTTLTHAILRVAQEDYPAAERLLRAVLEREPDHVEARRLLETIAERVITTAGAEPAEELPEPPVAGDPARLARAFRDALGGAERPAGERIRRLEIWLGKIRRDH
jgi:hypothetical protein